MYQLYLKQLVIDGKSCILINLKVSFYYNFIPMIQNIISKQPNEQWHSPLKNCHSARTEHSLTSPASSTSSINKKTINFKIQEARTYLFESSLKTSNLSSKLNKKAVNWIMTICWSKGYSCQCLWITLLLFYAYKSSHSIDKTKLEAILLTCLQLSSKLSERSPLTMADLLSTCSRPIFRSEITAFELDILEVVDYNLVFENCLFSLLRQGHLQEETQLKVMYLCELYLLRGPSILFEEEKFMKIVSMAQGNCIFEDCQLQFLQIREMMNERESKILVHKFGAKFDVDSFTQEFL